MNLVCQWFEDRYLNVQCIGFSEVVYKLGGVNSTISNPNHELTLHRFSQNDLNLEVMKETWRAAFLATLFANRYAEGLKCLD